MSTTPTTAPPARSRSDEVARSRPAYQQELALGIARFFEPRRTTCPWCGGGELAERVRSAEHYQHKPGVFVLDECRSCHHVFQNPRLSPAGLSFYYRDFYDGLGEKVSSLLFATKIWTYRRRARAILLFAAAPANWLDVGTGHGHFCGTAQKVLPDTVFDGLDFTDGAKIAQQAGRVKNAYSGSFVELAPGMAGQYAVVSMFHYLEHSTAPERDLEAARIALAPGGHLFIEVPDPGSRISRLLGQWWSSWFQPQHLHFIPLANLRRRLGELGFTVVAEQHAQPYIPGDLVAALWFMLTSVVPDEDLPWHAKAQSKWRLALRAALILLFTPLVLLTALVDFAVLKPLAGLPGVSNTYGVIARHD